MSSSATPIYLLNITLSLNQLYFSKHYFLIVVRLFGLQRNATQRNATQRNATQRNATQRHATQRNATLSYATQRNVTQYNARSAKKICLTYLFRAKRGEFFFRYLFRAKRGEFFLPYLFRAKHGENFLDISLSREARRKFF